MLVLPPHEAFGAIRASWSADHEDSAWRRGREHTSSRRSGRKPRQYFLLFAFSLNLTILFTTVLIVIQIVGLELILQSA